MQEPLDLPRFVLLMGGTEKEQYDISRFICKNTLSCHPSPSSPPSTAPSLTSS